MQLYDGYHVCLHIGISPVSLSLLHCIFPCKFLSVHFLSFQISHTIFFIMVKTLKTILSYLTILRLFLTPMNQGWYGSLQTVIFKFFY